MQKNKKSYRPSVIAAFLVAAMTASAWAESPDDILVIAHSKVGQDEMVPGEVKAIFLKKMNNWPSGDKIVPINAKTGSDLRQRFQEAVLEMEPTVETTYWEAQKIRQGSNPPVEFSDPIRAVFSLRGSISYVYRKDYKHGVAKVLLVIPSP